MKHRESLKIEMRTKRRKKNQSNSGHSNTPCKIKCNVLYEALFRHRELILIAQTKYCIYSYYDSKAFPTKNKLFMCMRYIPPIYEVSSLSFGISYLLTPLLWCRLFPTTHHLFIVVVRKANMSLTPFTRHIIITRIRQLGC
jgi:hypothetical protein